MVDRLTARVAGPEDASTVAELLDAFNREFATPTPGPAVLADRLRRHLGTGELVALLGGAPPVGVALISLRANAWYDGPVALLDELYVAPPERNRGLGSELLAAAEAVVRARGGELLEIDVDGEDADARRFYERHGYACTGADRPEPAVYYSRELASPPPS